MSLTLPEPLTPEAVQAVNPKVHIVLVASDKASKFRASKPALLKYSKLIQNMIGDDPTVEHDIQIPLDNEFCTVKAVQHLVLWLEHHENPSNPPSVIPKPMPFGKIADIITHEWDLQFIENCLVPGGKMNNHQELYALSCVGVFLDIPVLTDLCCAYLAWQLRGAVTESTAQKTTATSVVRSWFGLKGDFTKEEWAAVVEQHHWCKEITYGDIMSKFTDED